MKDADLLAWMDREGIYKISRPLRCRVSVELQDGSFGVAMTVTDALAKAKAGTDNVRRLAA